MCVRIEIRSRRADFPFENSRCRPRVCSALFAGPTVSGAVNRIEAISAVPSHCHRVMIDHQMNRYLVCHWENTTATEIAFGCGIGFQPVVVRTQAGSLRHALGNHRRRNWYLQRSWALCCSMTYHLISAVPQDRPAPKPHINTKSPL